VCLGLFRGVAIVTVKICTAEYMLSTVNGVGPARHWYPTIVKEAYLESTKDGEISRAPDPVTMIDGDLTYFNNTDDSVMLTMQIMRSARSIIAQSPNTVVIHDAWSHAKGKSPSADYPSTFQDNFGGKMQIDRPEAAAADLLYGRLFFAIDGGQAWEDLGELEPQEAVHFRYRCAVQTPGVWTMATEFQPRWEAHAYWARLLLFANPLGSR
jgi:hypothetical protein